MPPHTFEKGPLVPRLLTNLIFLRQLSSGDVPFDSAAGRLIAAYLAANRDVIRLAINWYYENTTEGQRAQLSGQNPMVDPSTVHEDFKKLALSIVEQVTEPWGPFSDQIELDDLRMLIRGLQTVEAHGEFDQKSGQRQVYRLLMSPVEVIWPAWEKAYAG
jgi:hypothetical protein